MIFGTKKKHVLSRINPNPTRQRLMKLDRLK